MISGLPVVPWSDLITDHLAQCCMQWIASASHPSCRCLGERCTTSETCCQHSLAGMCCLSSVLYEFSGFQHAGILKVWAGSSMFDQPVNPSIHGNSLHGPIKPGWSNMAEPLQPFTMLGLGFRCCSHRVTGTVAVFSPVTSGTSVLLRSWSQPRNLIIQCCKARNIAWRISLGPNQDVTRLSQINSVSIEILKEPRKDRLQHSQHHMQHIFATGRHGWQTNS